METQKVREAVHNGKLIDYLKGVGEYRIELHKWVHTNAPTDWTRVLKKGIYPLVHESPELPMQQLLEDSLIKLLEGDAFDIYTALSVLFAQHKTKVIVKGLNSESTDLMNKIGGISQNTDH